MKIQFAERKDAGDILDFIKQLAEYEHMADEVVATTELLEHWIFDEKKANVIFIKEDEKEVGFALYFNNFSTFLGRPGIYLEDLFIEEKIRARIIFSLTYISIL